MTDSTLKDPTIRFVFDASDASDASMPEDVTARFKTLAALEEALEALAPGTILELEMFLRDTMPFELSVPAYVHVTVKIHNESDKPITFSDNRPVKAPSESN